MKRNTRNRTPSPEPHPTTTAAGARRNAGRCGKKISSRRRCLQQVQPACEVARGGAVAAAAAGVAAPPPLYYRRQGTIAHGEGGCGRHDRFRRRLVFWLAVLPKPVFSPGIHLVSLSFSLSPLAASVHSSLCNSNDRRPPAKVHLRKERTNAARLIKKKMDRISETAVILRVL